MRRNEIGKDDGVPVSGPDHDNDDKEAKHSKLVYAVALNEVLYISRTTVVAWFSSLY